MMTQARNDKTDTRKPSNDSQYSKTRFAYWHWGLQKAQQQQLGAGAITSRTGPRMTASGVYNNQMIFVFFLTAAILQRYLSTVSCLWAAATPIHTCASRMKAATVMPLGVCKSTRCQNGTGVDVCNGFAWVHTELSL